MKTYYIYILASKKNGTLYIGMTNDLVRRISEHKSGLIEGFTKKYSINRLVYYESTEVVNAAILREKQLKKWKRQWKVELIEKSNPDWRDLSEAFI
jgi:putative endonuclease